MICAVAEQFRQREPLPGHLVPVVCVHELIIVHTVTGVSLHFFNSGFAAVQIDYVVYKSLAGLRQGDGFGGIRAVIFSIVGLARLIIFAGGGGGDGGFFDAGVCGHGEGRDMKLTEGAVRLVETRDSGFCRR